MPLQLTDAKRLIALQKARSDLGYNAGQQTYQESKLKAYNQRIKKKLRQTVNFGLNQEGGANSTNPPEIRDYLLWQIMKKIEQEAPENNDIQRKQKTIAIASIRALIYLRLNSDYAAELAFLYDVDSSIFHTFKLDAWNQQANNDLHDHGGWRSQEYQPLNAIGMNPRLTNHLDFYVRSFNDKQVNGPPWTVEEVKSRLNTEVDNIEVVLSAMVNQEYSKEKQGKFLKLFIDNILPSDTGCASERLQGAIVAIGTEMQGNHSFNELLQHLDACKVLIQLINSKDKQDLSKMVNVHLDLFVELQGQTIIFDDGKEITVSPDNYFEIIGAIKKYFTQIGVFAENTAPIFYKEPNSCWGSYLKNMELPEFLGSNNVGKLQFKTETEAEKAFLYFQSLLAHDYPEFAHHSKVKLNSSNGKFEFSISEMQYLALMSMKEIQ